MIKDLALAHVKKAREYSLGLLDSIPDADWLRMPPSCPTHILWQAAHLAVAQYRILVVRTCGPMPEDERFAPTSLIQRYGKDSSPSPDPKLNLSALEVRTLLSDIQAHAVKLAEGWSDADLQTPAIGPPHPHMKTKEDALWWCAHHELIHAGQIALLRRLLGHVPKW